MKSFRLLLPGLAALLFLSSRSGAEEAKRHDPMPPRDLVRGLLNDPNGDFSKLALALVGRNGGNGLFYFPTSDAPDTPKTWGWKFEDVWFGSKDGTRLHGWFIPAAGKKAKGTVVFSHGNAGAMGHHLGFVTWLLPEGFNVLMYDYRGFGKSGGVLDRHGMVQDVRAAFEYVKTRRDVDKDRLVSFGHSLGAAKSITALGETPVPGVKAVVSDGGFASYRGMAEVIAGRVGANIVTDEWAPKDWVAKVAPVPLLIVHGTADEVVPLEQGKLLFGAATGPKTMFTVKGGHHGDSLWRNDGEYRRKLIVWLKDALAR